MRLRMLSFTVWVDVRRSLVWLVEDWGSSQCRLDALEGQWLSFPDQCLWRTAQGLLAWLSTGLGETGGI